ncbi:MAG: long-chain fatty acid--CoA ligase [Cyclobacteriaceae bacterium]
MARRILINKTIMKYTRLFEILEHQLETNPRTDCLASKIDGKWQKRSTQQVIDEVNQLSLGLLSLGIQPDDKISIISFNRPEWNIVDVAIQQIGAISVPMYPTTTSDDYSYILQDSGAKIIFVSNQAIYEKARLAAAKQNRTIDIFTFDQVKGADSWETVKAKAPETKPEKLDELKSKVDAMSLMTLIYTSGTTGNPKGVMLSHNNIVSNIKACIDILPKFEEGKALSFLPLCHVYERMLSFYYMSSGISIYYAESMETIGENLKEVKPHIFTTVPRLLEKVYDKIYAKGLDLTGIKRKLFFWALKLGQRYRVERDQGFFYNIQLKLANKLIFSKWREALGGNVQTIVTGSAALQPRLSQVFWSAGIRVLEGYGLTETSPTISVNHPIHEGCKFGTVGLIIDGIEVKIDKRTRENPEEGEILVKGPSIMMGYYNQPEKTAEVIKDGWFHTGDVGTIVDGRFLKITGRMKEIFKTSGGKYISPQLLENKFKESTLIEQVMVVGEFKRFPAALIVPSFDNLKEWCATQKIVYTTDAEMIQHSEVVKAYEAEQKKYNEGFARFEQIKQFRLLPKLWTIEDGELTPTLKCKRKVILEKSSDLVDEIYEQKYEV